MFILSEQLRPTGAGAPHAAWPAPALPRLAAGSDHRVRVAGQKRERMRERLIDATLAATLACGAGRHPVVDDVVRLAGVSRGSFYKHFEAIDAVFDLIGQRMAQDMLASYGRLADPLRNAAARVAIGPLMALARAAMEPSHAAFITRIDFVAYLASDAPRSHLVALSVQNGRQCGALHFERTDAAVDLLIGASLQGARRILRTRTLDVAYLCELTAMVLQGLGVAPVDAVHAVALAWQRLVDNAATLHWWRPAPAA